MSAQILYYPVQAGFRITPLYMAMVAGSTSASTPLKKRPRTTYTSIDKRGLYTDLAPFANQRKINWQWDGSHYVKQKRSLGPDTDTLVLGLPVLQRMITAAPNGYPDQRGMRYVLNTLDDKFQII